MSKGKGQDGINVNVGHGDMKLTDVAALGLYRALGEQLRERGVLTDESTAYVAELEAKLSHYKAEMAEALDRVRNSLQKRNDEWRARYEAVSEQRDLWRNRVLGDSGMVQLKERLAVLTATLDKLNSAVTVSQYTTQDTALWVQSLYSLPRQKLRMGTVAEQAAAEACVNYTGPEFPDEGPFGDAGNGEDHLGGPEDDVA